MGVGKRRLQSVAPPGQGRTWLERVRELTGTQPQVWLSHQRQLLHDLETALELVAQALARDNGGALRRAPDVRYGIDFYAEVAQFEIELIERALRETDGSQARAALLLGLRRTTLNEKIKRYRIKPHLRSVVK
jgi:DNA-binding NtrC family response regulator